MEKGKRGTALTIFAICFALLAVSNLWKPVAQMHSSQAGFVFFGTKLTGTANLIIGPLFGIFLAIYAFGIWRMKRYAMAMAHAYASLNIIPVVPRGSPNPTERVPATWDWA